MVLFIMARLLSRQELASITFPELIHCLMMGDELLPKRSPNKNQRLAMINIISRVKYSAVFLLFLIAVFYI